MISVLKRLFNLQQIRFLFVGFLNTIVGYGIYALLVYFNVNFYIANIFSTVLGVFHSYLWNRYFTFKSKDRALNEIAKFISVYLVSFLMSNFILYIFISKFGMNKYLVGLINLIFTTLISWFGHKYFSFNNKLNFQIINKIKTIKSKIINWWKDTTVPSKMGWLLVIILLLFCFFTFNQNDLKETSTHGKDLVETTINGNFLSFYDYTQSKAVYLIPIYILFAIWSIPLFIISKIFNFTLWGLLEYSGVSFLYLMWYKILPVLFCLGTGFILYKIGISLGLSKNKSKWLLFLFISFPILIFSQFIFGQYDSFCMFFTMLAFYYYINNKMLKFSAFMSIAITFKLFPIFLMIPLLLLKEKKVISIFKNLIIGISGTIFCNFIFSNSQGFIEAKKFTENILTRFFYSSIPSYYGSISIFILIFLGICVLAYITKIENNKNKFNYWSIYLCLATYSSLFMTILWNPQWLILMVPFLVLSIFLSNENVNVTFILYSIIAVCYFLIIFRIWPKNVDEVMLNNGFLSIVFDKFIDGGNIKNIFSNSIYLNSNMIITFFVGSLLLNLLIKFPSNKNILNFNNSINDQKINIDRIYIILLICTIFVFILPCLYFFFKL